MERISELLDEVGWREKTKLDDWQSDVFRWMTEATNRIQELDWKVATLTDVCNNQQREIEELEKRRRRDGAD